MTRYDIENYYSAVNKSEHLLIVSTKDRIDDIVSGINEKIKNDLPTINIEVVHNMEGIQSYTLAAIRNNVCDVYASKNKILSGKTIMEIADYIIQQMPDVAELPYHKYIDRKDNDGNYVVKFFDDDTAEELFDASIFDPNNNDILGVFVQSNGDLEIHPVNHIPAEDMKDLIALTDYIKDESIRLYARTCLRIIPGYVATIPSGIDGHRYPSDNIAFGGLKRRIINTVEMMKLLTSQDYAHIKFTDREIDMMLTACLFCDAWHNGWQEDYEIDNSVKFEHPRIAANALRGVTGIVSTGTIKFITNCIESHMGQQNKSHDDSITDRLPVPDTEYKYTVHLANYITKQQNLCFVSHNTWYHYDDTTVTFSPRKTALSKDDLIIIQNALLESVDVQKANITGIDAKTEKEIKDVWHKLLQAKAFSKNETAYVELAKTVTML